MQRQEPEALRPSRVGCEYIVGAKQVLSCILVFEIDGTRCALRFPIAARRGSGEEHA